MRVDNHFHIRNILLYHFEKGLSAAEAFCDLNELFGEGAIGEAQARVSFQRFKAGDTSLEDKPGRGRPSDFDDQALLAAVEEDESLTTRILAEQFDVDHSTIVRRLKKTRRSMEAGWLDPPRAEWRMEKRRPRKPLSSKKTKSPVACVADTAKKSKSSTPSMKKPVRSKTAEPVVKKSAKKSPPAKAKRPPKSSASPFKASKTKKTTTVPAVKKSSVSVAKPTESKTALIAKKAAAEK